MKKQPLPTQNLNLVALTSGLVQNPHRHTDVAVKQIQKSMAEVGQLTPILVKEIRGKYIIADGHRRVRAAENLGWKNISARIYKGPLPSAQLWAEANGSTRGIKGADWFYGWSMETTEGDSKEFLKRMNSTTAHHIRGCIRLFGKKRAVEIALTGKTSPVIHSFASIVFSNMKGRLRDKMTRTEKEVGEWMIDHGSDVRKLIDSKPPIRVLKKLHTRMKNGEPFPRGEWD